MPSSIVEMYSRPELLEIKYSTLYFRVKGSDTQSTKSTGSGTPLSQVSLSAGDCGIYVLIVPEKAGPDASLCGQTRVQLRGRGPVPDSFSEVTWGRGRLQPNCVINCIYFKRVGNKSKR